MKHRFHVLASFVAVLALAVPAFAALEDSVQPLDTSPLSLDLGSALACGADVYNNTAASYFSSGTLPRWHVLDDGGFAAGTAPATVECVEIGINQSASSNLITDVLFYDTLTPAGPVCNATFLGGVRITWGVVPAGSYTSGILSLTTPIVFPDNDWAVELLCYSSVAPVTASATCGVLFANGGPLPGVNNAGAYYRDANANGTFECPGEARSFAAPNKAQFYLRLQRQLPTATEETTWGRMKSLYR